MRVKEQMLCAIVGIRMMTNLWQCGKNITYANNGIAIKTTMEKLKNSITDTIDFYIRKYTVYFS